MSRSSFFIEFIKKPRSIGSITPSSDALALGFCEAIRPYLNDKKNIIEIGGGTGTITRRLADLGKHLTVIEPNPALAQKIAAKYPKVQVVNSTIQAAIGQHISEKLLQDAVFISSLPMVSLPKKETAEIKKALFYLLKKSKARFPLKESGLSCETFHRLIFGSIGWSTLIPSPLRLMIKSDEQATESAGECGIIRVSHGFT